MTRRFVATWTTSLSAVLVALSGCGQNNVDTFDGVVDPTNFSAPHQANTDVDGDGINESILPKQAYANGKVVQFFDFGAIAPATVTQVDPTDPNSIVVATSPSFIFRFVGESDVNGDGVVDASDCVPPPGAVKSQLVQGFN